MGGTIKIHQGKTHPVGQKLSNPWGLYDMTGNIREWVYDWHGIYTASSRN